MRKIYLPENENKYGLLASSGQGALAERLRELVSSAREALGEEATTGSGEPKRREQKTQRQKEARQTGEPDFFKITYNPDSTYADEETISARKREQKAPSEQATSCSCGCSRLTQHTTNGGIVYCCAGCGKRR